MKTVKGHPNRQREVDKVASISRSSFARLLIARYSKIMYSTQQLCSTLQSAHISPLMNSPSTAHKHYKSTTYAP